MQRLRLGAAEKIKTQRNVRQRVVGGGEQMRAAGKFRFRDGRRIKRDGFEGQAVENGIARAKLALRHGRFGK